MRPSFFIYERASSIADAIEKLATCSGMAKPIAGGQSLVPMMNLRLARPNNLVSVRYLPDLLDLTESKKALNVGAAVTHAQLEDWIGSDLTRSYLSKVAQGIAYRAVRNRGTIGGSLCHADPAADWITSLSAIGAQCHIQGGDGKRQLSVEEFMVAPFVSVLQPNEILVSIEIPKLSQKARWAFAKFRLKSGEFAKSICAIVIDPENKISRVFIGGTDGPPIMLKQTSADLASGNYESLLKSAQQEIRNSLPETEDDRLAFHFTMVERALVRLKEFAQ